MFEFLIKLVSVIEANSIQPIAYLVISIVQIIQTLGFP